MPNFSQNNYIRTFGYVLRRTNYGEADRILNILTPLGKVSVIAKGVRKEKSKLAGGIEMFSLIDFNIRKGKSELGTITGAKMVKYYGEILKDYNKLELAAMFLKKVNLVANNSDSENYFNILGQSLISLNADVNSKLVEAWYLLNLNWASGDEMNLYRDEKDEKLEKNTLYTWDFQNNCFSRKENGEFGEEEIKMLRLMVTNDLGIIQKIKVNDCVLSNVLRLAKITSKI